MLRNRVWVLICFVFITVWSVGWLVDHSEAYEPWRGQVTARVNVRQAPGETNRIITQIDQGVEVTISDESDGWYKVVVEEDMFGFLGWVCGKYIRNPAAPAPASSPPPEEPKRNETLSSKPVTPVASHAASPGSGSRDRFERVTTASEALEKSAPADDKVAPGVKEKEIAPAARTERAQDLLQHRPQERSVEKKEADRAVMRKEMPEDRLPPYEVSVQKTSKGDDPRHVSSPKPSSVAGSVSPAAPTATEASVPVKALHKATRKVDAPIAIPRKERLAETGTTETENPRQNQGLRVVTGVVVKLVVVAFSCLALIFAYRAWQMTNARKS